MGTTVYRRRVVVKSEHGMHIRPCQMLAKLAMSFQSRIRLSRPGASVDAKSILDLMTLAAGPGVELDVEADGADSLEAIEQIVALFDTGFAPPVVAATTSGVA